MNRKYDINFYLKIIDKLKKARSNIEISSDFIVGYPGETDSDFDQTLDLIDKVKFTQSYSFIYSPRPGTKSAKEIDDVPLPIKKERLKILQEKLKSIQLQYNQNFVKNKIRVLIENRSSLNPNYFFGRTPFMQSVYVNSKELKIGDELNVQITSCNHKSLYGSC